MTTANNVLRPVASRGWLRGFANLLGHELHLWWGTRQWLMQSLIWILLINGAVAFMAIGIATARRTMDPAEAQQLTPDGVYSMLVQIFVKVAVLCTAVGAVVSAQGTLIQEKQMGTAAWILSKPVSRAAFVVAKVFAYALGLLVLCMLVPTIIFYAEISLFAGSSPAPRDLLAAMGIWSLSILFDLAFAIMLGAFLKSRGAVLGIGLGFMLLGGFAPLALPQLTAVFPWAFGDIAVALALGPGTAQTPPPSLMILPVIATSVWIVIFTALAIWRFGKEEF
jgi:ABC-2 type transport system permease protein